MKSSNNNDLEPKKFDCVRDVHVATLRELPRGIAVLSFSSVNNSTSQPLLNPYDLERPNYKALLGTIFDPNA